MPWLDYDVGYTWSPPVDDERTNQPSHRPTTPPVANPMPAPALYRYMKQEERNSWS